MTAFAGYVAALRAVLSFAYNLLNNIIQLVEAELLQEERQEEQDWVSLRVRSPGDLRDALVNFLVEQTGRGVQEEGEWLTAFCRRGEEAVTCLQKLSRYYQALRQIHPNLPALDVVQQDIRAEDWGERWKAFFKPIHIGKTIVVKPSWEPYEGSSGKVVIELDPGRAFGTGKHPSTALSIEILEQVFDDMVPGEVDSAPSVLDVGTGSGILGIVAAHLGARRVLGIDIDAEALEVARINLVRNGVGSVMAVSAVPLERVEETFDLVVANLTATLLISMADGLTDRVGGPGRLLIAGILTEQVEEVTDCFHRHHFKVVESRALEEWRAILLRR